MNILTSIFKARDKPKNATSGSSFRFFLGGSTAGKSVTERSAMQMTAVYSCVRMEGLTEYADLASSEVKRAVRKAGNTVKSDIQSSAPRRTGKYAKSWRTKTTSETTLSMEVTVYSPTRYMLAHLLEHGHAKRGGGRVRAIPHIAPAEEHGENQLMSDIEKALKG